MPFFSIVIPVYNRNEVLTRALLSCTHQTIDDFEVIVVDDGSPNSAEIEEIVASFDDARFRYIHRENGGGGAARNTGIDSAQGQYIAFLDSDDQFLPVKLATAQTFLKSCSDNRQAWFSKIWVDRGLDKLGTKPPRAPLQDERIDDYLICQRGFIQTSTLVVSTGIAKAVRFDEELPYGQDADFAIRLWENGVQFEMDETPLTIWDDTAAPGRVSSNRKVEALLRWADKMEGRLSRRSRLTYLGWYAAKASRHSNFRLALCLYMNTLLRGGFTSRIAVISGLQIVLGPSGYRLLVNTTLRVLGKTKA